MLDRVSPRQGQDAIASQGVIPASAPSITSSRTLFSQYRGPLAFNMAETEEEKKAREEKERKEKEDADKQSNFAKVQKAREDAEAKVKLLEKEKADREAADKKAADEKLAADGKLQELADARAKEAADKAAEAEREKARADAAEAKVKEFETAQEAELAELLKTLPDDKKPPLDPTDSVAKRLSQARHVAKLVAAPKPPIGGGARQGTGTDEERQTALMETAKKRPLTDKEAMELMAVES